MSLFDRPVLMWVTDRLRSNAPLPELAGPAAAAGVDLIQVREQGLDRLPSELLVRAIKSVTGPSVRVVVNGNIDLARKLRVGVHLPERGPSVEFARAELGASALVGRSVHSPESAAASVGADYLVAGHVFETKSKEGRVPLGLEGLAEIISRSPAPVLAIGGITPDRVADVLAKGAAGIAVMGPLTQRETVTETVAAYKEAMERFMSEPTTTTIRAAINGKDTELPVGTTVAAFLAGRDLHERLVVVERNGEIIKRDTFGTVLIENGDVLEIVHFVGGG
jgi:thiamine biosynthesis protein ThiS